MIANPAPESLGEIYKARGYVALYRISPEENGANMSEKLKTHCPHHGKMVEQQTRFGPLWTCGHPGCTVK